LEAEAEAEFIVEVIAEFIVPKGGGHGSQVTF
jgi:hypothetical protein